MAKAEWTLWQNGKAKQKKAAKEMGLQYKWESDRKGFKILYFTSTVHSRANRKFTNRKTEEAVDKFAKDLCQNWNGGKSVDMTEAENHQWQEIKNEMSNVKDDITVLEIVRSWKKNQKYLSQFTFKDVQSCIDKFIEHKSDEVGSDQVASIKRHLDLVFSPWLGKSLYSVGGAEILSRMDDLWRQKRMQNWAKETYDKYAISVKAFLKWGQDQEPSLVDSKFPIRKLKLKSGKDNTTHAFGVDHIKYFSTDNAYKILDTSTGWDKQGRSFDWLPILAMQFFGACRPSESMLIQWSQFDWEENQIHVRKRKFGGGLRQVEIKPNLKEILWLYFERAKGKGGLLPSKCGAKLYPAFYQCQKEFSKRKKITPVSRLDFEKKYKSVRDSAGQANNNIAKHIGIDWIYDGPRHSFGTYRYSQLRSDNKYQDPKEFLEYEMGTGLSSLDKNYIAAKVKPKQVEKYFSITA
ncbi:MAG: hypothetical protein CMM02_21830 [Rhodopirellula sp.]|nr:hypothetical protein [Rhodopirellula sp.]|tara:strand:- start:488 stop:1879 length:1392 start_codon:yes stop_codon:yes gene_type:complete